MTPRVLCPLCGGEWLVPQHRAGERWTDAEVALVQRLHSVGMSYIGIGRIMGGISASAIHTALERERERAE